MSKQQKSKFKWLTLKMTEIACANLGKGHQHLVDRTTLYLLLIYCDTLVMQAGHPLSALLTYTHFSTVYSFSVRYASFF